MYGAEGKGREGVGSEQSDLLFFLKG